MGNEADIAREARVVSLLEDNVRSELQVTNGMWSWVSATPPSNG
jgi:hypothetical protein